MKVQDIDVESTIESVKLSLKNEKDLSPALRSSLELLLLLVSLLLNRITLNSSTSSIPPSSDPNRTKSSKNGNSKRKPGGQKGHPGCTLEPVDDPDEIVPIQIDKRTIPTGIEYQEVGYESRQVIDIKISRVVTEYRAQILEDSEGNQYTAQFPTGVISRAQYGNSVRTQAVYLSQFQLIPYDRVRDHFTDQLLIPLSAGTICNFNRKAYEQLDEFDHWVKYQLTHSALLHVDETGININGKRHWLHCASNLEYTYYFPHERRGTEAYQRLREQLGNPVLPIDLWNRTDVPTFDVFRAAYKTWPQCQEANDDAPLWSHDIAGDHPVRVFLKAVESDWQAQRVWQYALLWGLCAFPDDPEHGYRQFFERWPQWRVEEAELDRAKGWKTLQKALGDALVNQRLAEPVLAVLGDKLLDEVEGRLLYTLARDYQTRHGGVLRTPDELNLFAEYSRPEIVRFFGVHYDPAKHNKGILWFENEGVVITKLDTSGAVVRHQYQNRFLSDSCFSWTSQNQMKPTNQAGLKVLNAESEERTLRLFVQPRSHKPALYIGKATVDSFEGSGPMQVEFRLERSIPEEVLAELGVILSAE